MLPEACPHFFESRALFGSENSVDSLHGPLHHCTMRLTPRGALLVTSTLTKRFMLSTRLLEDLSHETRLIRVEREALTQMLHPALDIAGSVTMTTMTMTMTATVLRTVRASRLGIDRRRFLSLDAATPHQGRCPQRGREHEREPPSSPCVLHFRFVLSTPRLVALRRGVRDGSYESPKTYPSKGKTFELSRLGTHEPRHEAPVLDVGAYELRNEGEEEHDAFRIEHVRQQRLQEDGAQGVRRHGIETVTFRLRQDKKKVRSRRARVRRAASDDIQQCSDIGRDHASELCCTMGSNDRLMSCCSYQP